MTRINRAVHKYGIWLFCIRFNSDELQQLQLKGRAKEVSIELPIADIRKVQVQVIGGPVLQLNSESLQSLSDPVSIEEWMAARAAVRAITRQTYEVPYDLQV